VVASFQTLTVNFNQPNLNNGILQKYIYSLNGSSYIDYPNTNLPMVITGLMNNTNYNIQVRAVTDIGMSTESALLTTPVRFTYLAPNPPRINSITGLNKTLSVNFTPSVIRGAPVTSYFYSFDGITLMEAFGQLTTPILITNLTNDASYNVRLYADSAADISTASNIIMGIPVFSVPTPPTITSIIPGNNSGLLNFSQPTSTNGTIIKDYVYSINNSLTYITANTTTSPILISGLTNDVSYNIRIAAVSDNGMSSFSQSRIFTPVFSVPTTPIINTITMTKTTATVVFRLSNANGGTISRYLYTLDNGVTMINTNATLSSTTGTFDLYFLTPYTEYSIRLVAENENGLSNISSARTFGYLVPSPPTINPISITTKNSATIPFTLGSANGGTINRVWYSINNSSDISLNTLATSFVINNLTSNVLNTITLKAENELGLSLASASRTFTCVYTVPSSPTIGNITTGKSTANVSFSLGSANGGIISAVEYSLNDASFVQLNNTLPFTLSDLSSNIPYKLVLRSINELGFSPSSTSRTFTCIYAPPNVPTINNITTTKSTANVSFSLGSANGGIISAVEYSLNDASFVQLNTTTSPFTISDLSSNVIHRIAIRAINELGSSISTATRTFTCVFTIPNAPSIGTITTTKNTAELTFTLGSANGGVISNVEYSLNDASFVQINKTTSPLLLTDLSSNILHKLILRSVNEVGYSILSASRTFTCVHTVPTAPTINLVRSNKGRSTVSFSESSANGGTISNYYYSTDNEVTYKPTNSIASPFVFDVSVNQTTTLRMKCENELGLSNSSNSVTFTSVYSVPNAPVILNAISDSSGVDILFAPGSPNSGIISGYYYTLDGGTTFTNTESLSNSFRVNLPNGSYNIQIRSENELGLSTLSAIRSFTIP
jgi:hypothetical protein